MFSNRVAQLRIAAGCIVMMFAGAPASYGYYDDIHYGLTYFLARMIGYSQVQAHRVASACVSIDYAHRTEPVQVYGAGTGMVGLTVDEPPRWKFHAFRNEGQHPNSAGYNVGQAGLDADRSIRVQRTKLYNQAFEASELNPGAYLHFYQDEVPHAAYGSNGGHWFRQNMIASPITTAMTLAQLPLGGTTDWLSYRHWFSTSKGLPDANWELARNTARTLGDFVARASNGKQKPVLLPDQSPVVMALLKEMREKNVYPEPVQANTAWGTALLKVLDGQGQVDWDKFDPVTREKMQKHLRGPDLEKAYKAVDAALAAAGMRETIPRDRIVYDFNSEGWFSGGKPSLFASLDVKIDESLRLAANRTGSAVLLKMVDRIDSEQVVWRITLKPHQKRLVFDSVPVGRIAVELHAKGVVLARAEVDLVDDKAELLLQQSHVTQIVTSR